MKTGYPKNKNGYSVFTCFAGGGGSTMGYKLAGYDVIGFNEIDKHMIQCYEANHSPIFKYTEPIQEFKKQRRFPRELKNLDVLDGSPPCSLFSLAGNREKDWGKKRRFNEGQCEQVLDRLFFDFIDLTSELKPKIVIAENVQGILFGEAERYVTEIYKEFKNAGYVLTHKLLDGSYMGVPQKRMRVFFVGIRKDLLPLIGTQGFLGTTPKITLKFNEPQIKFKDMIKGVTVSKEGTELSPLYQKYWKRAKQGEHVGKHVNCKKIAMNRVMFAQTTGSYFHPTEPRRLGLEEFILASTFPLDYDFCDLHIKKKQYIMGMCVPPVMMAHVAKQVQIQWLDKIKEKQNADNKTNGINKRFGKHKGRNRK